MTLAQDVGAAAQVGRQILVALVRRQLSVGDRAAHTGLDRLAAPAPQFTREQRRAGQWVQKTQQLEDPAVPG